MFCEQAESPSSRKISPRAISAPSVPLGIRCATVLDQPLQPQLLKAPTFGDAFTIVGIVGTARNRGLDEAPWPAAFAPYSVLCSPGMYMLARTQADPMTLANSVRNLVTRLDAHQPLTEMHPLSFFLQLETAYPRFAVFLFGVFGGVGLLLAGAGVFSVVSYSVAQRTREFGIRMAMGANPGDVLRLVLRGAGIVFSVGLICGLLLSVFAARALAGQMQGMGRPDVGLFVVVPIVLLAATLLACFVPARAATLVAPAEALRQE